MEFDPDDAPKVRSFDLTLHAVDEVGFECSLYIHREAVCGVNTYEVNHAGAAAFLSYDCTGVPDGLEGEWWMDSGQVVITDASAGDKTGNFTNEKLFVDIEGSYALAAEGGHALAGSFDIHWPVTGQDAEEVTMSEGLWVLDLEQTNDCTTYPNGSADGTLLVMRVGECLNGVLAGDAGEATYPLLTTGDGVEAYGTGSFEGNGTDCEVGWVDEFLFTPTGAGFDVTGTVNYIPEGACAIPYNDPCTMTFTGTAGL